MIVFDPDSRTREALAFGFAREGHKVYSTNDASDALGMAQTRVPQLVICAGESEDQAALDLIGRLREVAVPRGSWRLWRWGSAAPRESTLRAGADEFVAKPAFIRDVLTLSRLTVAMRQDGDEAGCGRAARRTSSSTS